MIRQEFILEDYQIKTIYLLLLVNKYKIKIGEFRGESFYSLVYTNRSGSGGPEESYEDFDGGNSPRYILDKINAYYKFHKFRDERGLTFEREDVKTILVMLENKEEEQTEEEKTLFQVLFLAFKF